MSKNIISSLIALSLWKALKSQINAPSMANAAQDTCLFQPLLSHVTGFLLRSGDEELRSFLLN